MTVRLSVDIGGTFTDVVLQESATLTSVKVLTTHADPVVGVLQGVDDVLTRSGVEPADVQLVLHGTTLATNALIERRGAKTALLTTAGHRDVLAMAFENRFEQYDVNIDRPAPLVPRHWRVGVTERVAADGQILLAMDDNELLSRVDALIAQGVESLAVTFLHSYRQPAHELRVAQLVKEQYPQLWVSLSCEVCPEIREYERTSTTTANAYVKPLMAGYLERLQAALTERRFNCKVLLMTSGGGLTTLKAATRFPIRLVESGPAGGAMLAASVAQCHDENSVVSFDMGGTTAKLCLIEEGMPQHSRAFEVDRSYRFKKGSGLPVRIPVVEMVEIGAGGGSIASLDNLRRIHVGPQSAGSEPGPSCYGRGGTLATVTDADLLLGRLLPENFAGGRMKLSHAQATQAITEQIAQPLMMDVRSAALGVSEIVDENMAAATRAHAAEWGKRVQGTCLVAFGGAAPLHAARLAQKLKIPRVLVPAGAGVGSAIGFLLAPVRYELVRSAYVLLAELDQTAVTDLFTQMRHEAEVVLKDAGTAGAPEERREGYMRYVGQGYEIAVDVSDLQNLAVADIRGRFERTYKRLYGRTIPNLAIEVLSWTLSLSSQPLTQNLLAAEESTTQPDLPAQVQWWSGEKPFAAQVIARSALQVGEYYAGPLLIAESQTTTIVPHNARVSVRSDATLCIEFEMFED
ncbi:MAG: hydantoinase/oxoprolinase family protein [bacterium]